MTDTDASTLRRPLDFAALSRVVAAPQSAVIFAWRRHQLLRLDEGEIRPFPAKSEEAA